MLNSKESFENEVERFKELPKYFVVKKDFNNPLWRKYIDWLNKTYKGKNSGIGYDYYGYDNDYSSSRNGVNYHNVITSFKNNPTLLTLEQWNYIVNLKDENYTIQQCIDKRIAISCSNKEECLEVLKALNIDLISFFNEKDIEILPKNENKYSWAYGKDFNYFINSGQATKCIKFKQLNLDKMEEKKIIGYKAPYDLFGGRVEKGRMYCKITYRVTDQYTPHKEQVSIYDLPKEIVESWEAVYKEELKLPVINGYQGKIEGDLVIYGNNCAKFNKQFFLDLYLVLDTIYSKDQNRSIKSITLGSEVVITVEQIKQIVEYINANKG